MVFSKSFLWKVSGRIPEGSGPSALPSPSGRFLAEGSAEGFCGRFLQKVPWKVFEERYLKINLCFWGGVLWEVFAEGSAEGF